MKYKTLKGLCKYLSQANQQDKIKALENRNVWSIKDFNTKDITEIEETCKQLQYTIQNYDNVTRTYEDFKNLLKQLQDITQYLFYGTLIQDEIIAHLTSYKGGK